MERPGIVPAYPELDSMAIARRLGGMVRFATVSSSRYTDVDWSQFEGLHRYLEETYPLLNEKLEKKILNDYALFYRWKGSGTSGKRPILFMAHQDVVAVAPGTEGDWEQPPFGGDIVDGFVWGRGSCDCKSTLCLTMEAVTWLLERGFTPDRDVYLAFGHDEEVGGEQGAGYLAEYCKNEGILFDAVFDEGPGFNHGDAISVGDTLLFTVNVFEKGYVDLELVVKAAGGHSSKPERTTALGDLARAIVKVEENPFAPAISECVRQYLEAAGPYIEDEELRRLCVEGVEKNRERIMACIMGSPAGCAMMRTTTAATMASASPAPNVLPQRASAVINFRLNPTETVESVVEHVTRAIGDDRVAVRVLDGRNPSNLSDTRCEAYRVLKKTVNSLYPDAIVVPFGSLGGTDSRRFEAVCPHVYRISPIDNTPYRAQGYTSAVHGTNEKAVVKSLAPACVLYIRLMENLCTEAGRSMGEE